jgi:hypothetical protein
MQFTVSCGKVNLNENTRISLDPVYRDWGKLMWSDWGYDECRIALDLPCSTLIVCGLNGTAIRQDESPRVRFFINNVPVGESEYSRQMTDGIVLDAGKHELLAKIIDPCRRSGDGGWQDGLSLVWCLKEHRQLTTRDIPCRLVRAARALAQQSASFRFTEDFILPARFRWGKGKGSSESRQGPCQKCQNRVDCPKHAIILLRHTL